MKKLNFRTLGLLMAGFAMCVLFYAVEDEKKRNDAEIQEATSFPEWFSEKEVARGYNIERKSIYGKTVYILVDSGGQPIQMIMTN